MPGVPSGRGCEGCRKQKKKCDLKTPCSRCARLDLTCIGAGQQRYVFKESNLKSSNGTVTALQRQTNPGPDVVKSPSNALSLLLNSLLATMSQATDFRYNLLLTYGIFLQDVPKRLGTNEALDTSVAALISSHSDVCLHPQEISPQTLARYTHAIGTLRTCLDQPIKARAAETLCAVMILLICQSFIGSGGQPWTGHCEGAAHILKVRGYYNPRDEFERKLLLTLRGPVLFEGLFNEKIQFTPQEWNVLVKNELGGSTAEDKMMCSLAHFPEFVRRGLRLRKGEGSDPGLAEEVNIEYQNMKAIVKDLKALIPGAAEIAANPSSVWSLKAPLFLHFLYSRGYGLALMISMMFNRMLDALNYEDDNLDSESTYFAEEILSLADQSHRYRPLGSSYIILCLVAVSASTDDEEILSSAKAAIQDYQRDWPWKQDIPTTLNWDWGSRKVRPAT